MLSKKHLTVISPAWLQACGQIYCACGTGNSVEGLKHYIFQLQRFFVTAKYKQMAKTKHALVYSNIHLHAQRTLVYPSDCLYALAYACIFQCALAYSTVGLITP